MWEYLYHPCCGKSSAKISSNHEGKSYLVTVCHFSDWTEIDELTNTLSTTIIVKTKTHFARHGVPSQCHTDNGLQFISLEYENFASSYGFCHSTSSPYHWQGNGRAEAAVKVCKTMLKKSDDLDAALLNYRNTPPQGHSYSPAQRLFNRRTRTTIPTSDATLVPEVVFRVTVHQEHQQSYNTTKTAKVSICRWQLGTMCMWSHRQQKRGQPWACGSPAPRSYVIETPQDISVETVHKFRVLNHIRFITPPLLNLHWLLTTDTHRPFYSDVEPDVRMHAEVAPARNDYHRELEAPRKEPPRPAEPPWGTESRSLNSPIRQPGQGS